jgi:YD repeat-containing protein
MEGRMTDQERHDALRALADAWWDPPAEMIDTLPKGGVDLRYLSHAWVRKALQDHDPDWWWEPMGYDDQGQPVVERDSQGQPVGLWIWLHVLGTKRAGYGSVEPGKRDAIKELIGDSLRNSAQPVCGGALWIKTKPARKPPAKKQTAVDREIDHLRQQVDPPADESPHHETAAGKDVYDAMVSVHGEEIVNGALATHKVMKFSELTPAKAKAIEASLIARARIVKEQADRAEQLAREKANG